MSVLIVPTVHVDAMVTAAISWRREDQRSPLKWWWGNPTREAEAPPERAQEVGQMLVDENMRAWAACYPRESHLARVYRFSQVPGTPDPVTVLKLVRFYAYQADESDAWTRSEAFAFCEVLTWAAIYRLPGYELAPWGAWEADRTRLFAREAR